MELETEPLKEVLGELFCLLEANIKWLAARKRMEHLLTPIPKEAAVQKEITDNMKEAERRKSTEAQQSKPKPFRLNLQRPKKQNHKRQPTPQR